MNRLAAALLGIAVSVAGWFGWAQWLAEPPVRATHGSSTVPTTVALTAGTSDVPMTDERPHGDAHHPSTSLALQALNSDESIAALLDERIACARAGDSECMVDAAILLEGCEHHFQFVRDESAEALAKGITRMQDLGIAPVIIERTKRTHLRCAEITKAKVAGLGPSSAWMHRAFDAGHPIALVHAAAALEFLMFAPITQRQSLVLPRESYESQPRIIETSSAFIPNGDYSDAAIAQQSERYYATALADSRPEVLMRLAFRNDVQRDARLTDAEQMIVSAGWIALACTRGLPCHDGSFMAENMCLGTCPPGTDVVAALAMRQGVGFQDRVGECAARLDALLAAGDQMGALKERCR